MIQVLDKYGNTSTDDARVVIIDKFGNVKKPATSSGTVTSIVTASPLTGGTITTTGTIGITQATTSTDGYLSSTDWNTFNSKFNLPTLTNGSVLFSNGTTIAEDPNLFWDYYNVKLSIGTNVPSPNAKVTIDMGTIHGTHDGVLITANCTNNPGITGVRFNLLNTTANASGFIRMVRAIGTTYLGMQISSQSRDGIAFLTDTVTPTEKMRLTANGNLLLGTTSDNSSKLNVQGTITASSAIARGVSFNNTLVAAANSDVLVGLDINPTFTNGAFTGVSNYAIRIPNGIPIIGLGSTGLNLPLISAAGTGTLTLGGTFSGNTPGIRIQGSNIVFANATTTLGAFFTGTGNLAIQNGGAFTDVASSRLTINSTTQGVLLPRMTTAQVNAIVSPVQGLTVFNTDLNTLCFYTTSWQKVTSTTM